MFRTVLFKKEIHNLNIVIYFNSLVSNGTICYNGTWAIHVLVQITACCLMAHHQWGPRSYRGHLTRIGVPIKAITTWTSTVKCHYNACHYNANASLTRSILGSQTAPTCPHDHPRVAQHMGYRCEIIAVWSATAAMTPLCSHTNGIKQRYPTCWLCQYSRFMIDLRSNTLIIHLRYSENAINRPIWLPDARMLKTISVAIKLT